MPAYAAELKKLSAPNDDLMVASTDKNRTIERFFRSSDNSVNWLPSADRRRSRDSVCVPSFISIDNRQIEQLSRFIAPYPEYIDGQGKKGNKEDKKEGKERRKEERKEGSKKGRMEGRNKVRKMDV